MATPLVTLITNGAPYTQPNINPFLRKAIIIYGKLAFCQGGAYNYTNAGLSLGDTELKLAMSDMRASIGALTPDQVEAARAFLWPRSSIAYFAGVATTLATQIPVVDYLSKLDLDTLNKLDLWAEYAMNVDINSLP